MPPLAHFGDVIASGKGRAMFLCWGEPWRPEQAHRPTQMVVIVSDCKKWEFSFRPGEVVRVNWLTEDGTRFTDPVEYR